MKTFFAAAIFMAIPGLAINTVSAQDDCSAGLAFKQGATFEMRSFDAKNKLQSVSTNTVKSVKNEGGALIAEVNNNVTDHKGKPVTSADYTVSCRNGIYEVNMRNFFDPAMMKGYEGMTVKIDGNNLEVPSKCAPGQTLNDGKVSMVVEGPFKMTNTIEIKNRKVEGMETVTTPAGTFNAMKISYDIFTKIMVSVTGRGEEWYVPGIGTVQTKSYDSKGNLTGYTQLTSYTR